MSIFRSFQRILKMAFVAMVLCFVTSVSFGDTSCNCTNGNGASGCYGTPVKDPTGDGNNMSCIYNWSCQNGYYTYPTTTQTSETSYTATCDLEYYDIAYYLDGGSWPPNNPTNPSTYNVETQTFTISTPTKTGYVFAGWCEDAALTTNCSQTKTIATGSMGDRAYYAKWSCDTGYHRQNFDFDLNITTNGTSSNYDSNANTWEVFFGDETPEFTLSGSALCSTYNGNESATEAQIQAGANSQQADVCWCKLTSYTDNNNTTINPSDQLWAKQRMHITPGSCRQDCADGCAEYVSNNADHPGFARQLFNAANDLCVPDAGTITYNCGQQPGSTTQTGTVPSPQSVEFGEEYDLAANSCAYAGYRFIGWNCSHNLDAGTVPQDGHTYSFDGTAANAPSFTYQVSGNNSAVTCTAQWTPITHTITVNRDGGNGAIVVNNGGTSETVSANSTTFTCNEGDTVTFPGWGADNSLNKTGYVFTGWNEGNTALNAGISCDADRTITAQWAQCTCTNGNHSTCGNTASVSNNTCSYDFTCDTHYDYNGESGGTATASAGDPNVTAGVCAQTTHTITFKTGNTVMGTQTCNEGETVTLDNVSGMSNIPVNTTQYSVYGWQFRGWQTVSHVNGTTLDYTNGANYVCSADITLYGLWKREVWFEYYSGFSSNQTFQTHYLDYQYYRNVDTSSAGATAITTPSSPPDFSSTDRGWSPIGWVRSGTWQPVFDFQQQNVEVGISEQRSSFVAKYERTPLVVYDGNGNTAGATSATTCGTQFSRTGTAIVNSSCMLENNGFTRTGHVFTGWNTAADGTGTPYAEGSSYAPPGAFESVLTSTLYAQWTPCSCVDGNHSTCGNTASVSNNTCSYDFTCDTHYNYNNASGGTVPASAAGVGTVQAPDCSPITHTITVVRDGGNGAIVVNNGGTSETVSANSTTFTCNEGDTVTFPNWGSPDNLLTKTGNVFTGWDTSTFTCSANTTVTAQWTPNTYNITYHNTDAADGVSWADQNDKPSTYTYGTGATIGVPSRTGYTFAGWCRGTVLCYNYAGTENGYTITTTDFGDIDLYAVWIPHNVNLVWDSNGGTEINTPDSCEFGGTIENILKPTKTGYSFAGWVLKCWLPDTIVSERANAWAGRGLNNNSEHTWGGATASTYGITQPGQWGASWNSGDKVLGEAFCSTTSGAPGSTASVIEMTEGVNCWCRLTSYTSNNAEQCDVMPTIWVHNGGASLNIANCKSSCDRACTNSMSGYDVGFRTALVGNNVSSP